MKITYAYIHEPWEGTETFKVVPFERIDRHGKKRLMYSDIWAMPGGKTVSTVELENIVRDMWKTLTFETVEEATDHNLAVVLTTDNVIGIDPHG